MARNRLRYLAVLLGALIFFFCFNGYLSLYMLIVVFLFPFAVFLLSLPGMLGARLELAAGAPAARKGQSVSLRLWIGSRFPVVSGRAMVTLTVRNTLTGEAQEERFAFTPCRGKQAIAHQLSSPSCGQVICSLSKGWVWDYLGLFALPLRLPDPVPVLFYPSLWDAALSQRAAAIDNEGDGYSQARSGDDPSELFSLRDFREGDRISRIHWKLSEKTGDTIVKEFGQPVADHTFFLVELNGTGGEADALLDLFATLSAFLCRQDAAHRVGFWNKDRFELREILAPEDLNLTLRDLLSAGLLPSSPSLENQALPSGVSHALYLSCKPGRETAALLHLRMPSALLSVLQATEAPGVFHPQLPEGAEALTVRPGHIPEALNGFQV